MEGTDVETARARLEEARQVLDHGRDGASAAWLAAVEDYVSKCQEEYVRALERANTALSQPPKATAWTSPSDGDGADQERGSKPH